MNNRLKAWREKAGLSQSAAGERFGVSQQGWSKWEAGGVPEKDKMLEIVEITKDDPEPLTPNHFYDIGGDVAGAQPEGA